MLREFIVVHHSLTKDGTSVSWNAIRKFHMLPKSNGGVYGMVDVGYHFGVELIGDHVEKLVGRSIRMDGAHTRELGMNRLGIGVCVVGNFDLLAPPDPIWRATVSLVRDIMLVNNIPAAKVIGHREAGMLAGYDWTKGQFKTCPGKLWDMDAFRVAVA